jgi:Na+-transporting methylmalonyl-CoA/oxaloacetate decarboxylase gamma subunit
MTQNLMIALQITVVGMGLVFTAILLLWGLMALLVRFTKDSPEAAKEPATETAPIISAQPSTAMDLTALRRRAAAAAVAIALARQGNLSLPHEFPLPPTPLVSAWQAVMRTRILSKRGPTR